MTERWAVRGMYTRDFGPPPMVKRRDRCFASLRRFRRQYVSRVWVQWRHKPKARGLRVWKSARYEYGGRP